MSCEAGCDRETLSHFWSRVCPLITFLQAALVPRKATGAFSRVRECEVVVTGLTCVGGEYLHGASRGLLSLFSWEGDLTCLRGPVATPGCAISGQSSVVLSS